MNTNAPVDLKQLTALLRQGEGPTLEFKRSAGEMKEAKPVNPLIAGEVIGKIMRQLKHTSALQGLFTIRWKVQ